MTVSEVLDVVAFDDLEGVEADEKDLSARRTCAGVILADGSGRGLISMVDEGDESSDPDEEAAMSMAPRKTSNSTLTSPVSEETFFVNNTSAGVGKSFLSSFWGRPSNLFVRID